MERIREVVIHKLTALCSMAALVGIAAALSGCTQAAQPQPLPSLARQTVLEELGPYPADTLWGDGEREQALSDAADTYWSRVTTFFPSAPRPAVSREEEVAAENADTRLADCLRDEGVKIASVSAREYTPTTESENLAWYTCEVRFPRAPRPPVNDAQLGYLYDYLTMFVVPCLEQHGVDQTAPPTRADFVSQWPNQHWFPSATPEVSDFESINAACPSSIGGY